jgi:hypothetical protein
MNERSDDIYRTKGVLSIDGWDERFIFQVGVSLISYWGLQCCISGVRLASKGSTGILLVMEL